MKEPKINVESTEEPKGVLIDTPESTEEPKVVDNTEPTVESMQSTDPISNPKQLKDTYDMMVSSDYAERFNAEYFQVKIRANGLKAMLQKYKTGTLSFKPTCSYSILKGQLSSMLIYASFLERRANAEKINLK